MIPAFVTALLALSSTARPSTTQTTMPESKPRPSMLPCGTRGECPPGSQCLKLFQSFGVCVLEAEVQHTT